ncbi:MAG TPA: GNAT family N-acetyltransferase [Gaiellales bacterium]|nr:GNAT family N-acetyltransferase [Gaiellales bacterium]
MSLAIRAAGPLDRHALEGLCAQLLREHQDRFADVYPTLPPDAAAALYAAEWARRLDADPTCLVWLAVDRAPVGFLAAEVWTRPIGQPTAIAFGEWLYVSPEQRGQGVALALVRQLVTACRERGLTHVELQTVAGDRQWQRRGWAEVSRRYMRPVDALADDVEQAAHRFTWLRVNAEGKP